MDMPKLKKEPKGRHFVADDDDDSDEEPEPETILPTQLSTKAAPVTIITTDEDEVYGKRQEARNHKPVYHLGRQAQTKERGKASYLYWATATATYCANSQRLNKITRR